jgi:small lipoprotein (TIGR04452 family)
MKIKRILFTGVSVLAISALSNCFLINWVGEALDPYGSVDGAKARELIQQAASDGYSYAGITYTSSKTKVQKATESISANTVTTDNEPTPGFGARQTAFVKEVVKLAANIDPGQTYTAASVKNCISAVQAASFATAYSKIESTDTNSANCLTGIKSFADSEFSKVMVGSCYVGSASSDAFSTPGTAATGNTGRTCQACLLAAVNTAGTSIGLSYYATNLSTGSVNSTTATNEMIPWMDLMRTNFLDFGDNENGNTMEAAKDGCMELYMAAIAAGAGLEKCAKIQGAGGITEATTLTGFVGGTSCELEPTGKIVSLPFLNL